MSDGPRRDRTDERGYETIEEAIAAGDRGDERGYDTIEEAIAAAMAALDPGGIVTIHDGDCAQDDADESKCTCTPLELVVGAQA